ncbi:unnamed protein product [Phaedon cochleariae]|uniref:Lysosome-associated membrane glycoprotein 5 n=1 Tax=Phaedon cochleariae TaxID=80249 RepID=A0A9N9SE62_PHACE|nr:unnamed protein product [Phaedon cochleariae]
MAPIGMVVSVEFFVICTILISVASGLTLNQPTSKPRHTKYVTSTTEGSGTLTAPSSSTNPKDNSGVAYYRLFNSKTGATCILLKTDALVEVKFRLHDLEEQADSFIPEKALIDGDCRNEDASSMTISWTGYSLVINFAKTPGGERWYISSLGLTVSPDLPAFHGIPRQGKSSIKLYHRQMLIPTPVGKSYSCKEIQVDLSTDEDDHPPPGLRGSLYLRLLQVQPFMYKGENFEAPFECKAQRAFADETAPIAVGSTLAIAVLVTVSGYGVYRYFKVKNVQYNTME